MDNEEKLKGALLLAFFGVLIGGAVITFNNFHSWNNVRVSVVNEYRDPGKELNTDLSQQGSDVMDSENDDRMKDGTTIPEDDLSSNSDGNNKADPVKEDQTVSTGDPADHDQTDIDSAAENPDPADPNGAAENRDMTDPENDQEENNNESDDNMQEKVTYREGFYITGITDEIFDRIKGKSFPDSCTVSRDDLRYVHVRHYGFEGEVREGELIVNAAIAQDVIEIFQELYDIKYQIEKIRLIDEYDADDERSMEANNSSCFNYRTIAESSTLSNHAYGRAIDINPFYNPYVYERSDGSLFLQPKGSEKYVDRTVDAACIIRNGDACYNIFTRHGFSWGGDWNTKKDYQHFEKTQ